jgi:hypothetical protein
MRSVSDRLDETSKVSCPEISWPREGTYKLHDLRREAYSMTSDVSIGRRHAGL